MSKTGDWLASWKLISWRTAFVVAFVLYTLIGFLVVPWVAKWVIVNTAWEKFGREVTVEKVECNPFNLSLTIQGLNFPDRPGSTMLSFDELYADAEASSLFRWALTLRELRVDGLYIAVRRFEDKGVNLVELMEALDTGEARESFELPRALLRRIVLNGGRMDIEDRAREKPLLWTEEPIQALLHDISTIPDEKGDNDITIGLPAGGVARIRGNVVIEPLGLDGSVSLEQLMLANAWEAIAQKFKLSVNDGVVAADINYKFTMGDKGPHFQIHESEFRVSDFSVQAEDVETNLVKADTVVVSGVMLQWPEQKLNVDSLTVDGASAFLWLEPDGTPSWNVLVPKKTQDEIVEAYHYVKKRVTLDARIGRVDVLNASGRFEDRTFDEPVVLEVAEVGLGLTDVSTEQGSVWGIEAAAAMGEGSRTTADGTMVAIPLAVDANVGIEGLDLSQFQGYVARFAPLDLRTGVLAISGKAHLAPKDEAAKITFAGELAMEDLDLSETVTGGKLLGWGDLKIGGVVASLFPAKLDVEKVDIFDAGLEIAVAKDGSVNLLEFLAALGESEGEPLGPAAGGERREDTATQGGLPPVHIAGLELHECYGRFTDASTLVPFERKVHAVNGTISNISTDTTAGSDLEIGAAVDSGGVISVSGELDPFDYKRLTALSVDVRDLELKPMSPMSIKMIGFPISAGSVALDLDYEIKDSQLVSTNHVEVAALQLGDKVEGQGAIDLPVKLGVSLLKDRDGVITLDIPIAGDLETPGFVMGSAISAAVRDLLGELAMAPFHALGRLAGGDDGADLEFVEFKAGSAVLRKHAADSLATLARALELRPDLGLEINGAVDPEVDLLALRQAALASTLGVEGTEFSELESGHPIAPLEALYRETLSSNQMAALQSEHSAENALDEVAYRKALVDDLVAVQMIDEGRAGSLGPARAEAIRAYLVDRQGVAAGRIIVASSSTTTEAVGLWVRCQLAVVPL